MSRVKFPQNSPKKTEAYKRFESQLEDVNDFYWALECSLEYTATSVLTVKNLADLNISKSLRLNVSSADFICKSEKASQFARNTLIVFAVTIFEEYLKDVLTRYFVKNLKRDKNFRIQFRPEDVHRCSESEVKQYFIDLAIKSNVEDILTGKYKDRHNAILNIIKNGGVVIESHGDVIERSVAACEVRNCIVHSAGIVDERASLALSTLVPSIAVGSVLRFDERLTWDLLGALRDSVRIIDHAFRKLL